MRRLIFISFVLCFMSSCAKEEIERPLTNEALIASDYSALVEYVGREVDVTVRLYGEVREERGRFWQTGWLEAEAMTHPIAFEVEGDPLYVEYAHVRGTIEDVHVADHLFEEVIVYVTTVTLAPSTYFDVHDPAIERRDVAYEQTVNGVTTYIDAIERTDETWRLFVRVRNATDETVVFFSNDSTLRVANRDVREESVPAPRLTLPHHIEPDTEVEGVIVYRIASPFVPWTWTLHDERYPIQIASD